jgi:hypothetical protein
MLREIYSNREYRILFDAESRVISLIRSTVPQTAASLNSFIDELLGLLRPLQATQLLLDIRQAPGNNDQAFELEGILAMGRLLQEFSEIVVLVQTAIGRLHFQRIVREHGQNLRIFQDEQEALRYLVGRTVS